MTQEALVRFARTNREIKPAPKKQIVQLLPLGASTYNLHFPEFKLLRFPSRRALYHSEFTFMEDFAEQNELLCKSIVGRACVLEENGNFSREYTSGATIAYRALQTQARAKCGIPVCLSSQNLERSERDLYGDANFEFMKALIKAGETAAADELDSSLFATKRPELIAYLNRTEPTLMQTIRNNCRPLIPGRTEALENGVIDVYFPFKLRQEVSNLRRISKIRIQ